MSALKLYDSLSKDEWNYFDLINMLPCMFIIDI